MDKEEWQGYVQKIATCRYPIPTMMIADYNDWHCRSVVGRMLFILKDIEGAMRVLATTRDVVPDMEDHPDTGLSDCEHKVLCLRDIAEIVWQLTGTADAPMVYLKEADRLSREYKYGFHSADRGFVWVRQLELKRACGMEMEALQEAAAMVREQQSKDGINAYRYYALKFIAEDAAERGQYAQAVALLREAYKYYPRTAAADTDIAEALAAATAEEQYAMLQHCTTIKYRHWEAFHVPTIEEVRKRQYENFLAREADKQQAAAAKANAAAGQEATTAAQETAAVSQEENPEN